MSEIKTMLVWGLSWVWVGLALLCPPVIFGYGIIGFLSWDATWIEKVSEWEGADRGFLLLFFLFLTSFWVIVLGTIVRKKSS